MMGSSARQAAELLLRMAKQTVDRSLSAKLVQRAADLKDQAGELPSLVSSKAPDVQPEA
jgi:hypothetical protein